MACKTIEQLKAEAEAALRALEDAQIAEDKQKRAEDDLTNVNVVPIEVTDDDSTVDLEGMFFNQQGGFREEDEPKGVLEIRKDVLDRSSGYIIGRFQYEIAARAKIVYRVSVDGKMVDDYGTGLPYGSGIGYYDTVLFKYPNSARANKLGSHAVQVEYGLITGIAESALGLLDWGKVRAKGEANFIIKLLPRSD